MDNNNTYSNIYDTYPSCIQPTIKKKRLRPTKVLTDGVIIIECCILL